MSEEGIIKLTESEMLDFKRACDKDLEIFSMAEITSNAPYTFKAKAIDEIFRARGLSYSGYVRLEEKDCNYFFIADATQIESV